jgi:hypothetical protein
VIGRIEPYFIDARRGAGNVAHFGLTLAQVAPIGMTVPKTQLGGLVNDIDDTHVGNVPKSTQLLGGLGH